jgi:phosphatidate cytidylyltransferase
MSRPSETRSFFSSQTLAVDSGEELSEDENVTQANQESAHAFIHSFHRTDPIYSQIHSDSKPTKSALKRAQKQARTERRQQQKALAKAERKGAAQAHGANSTPSEDANTTDQHMSDNEVHRDAEDELSPPVPPKDELTPVHIQPSLNPSSLPIKQPWIADKSELVEQAAIPISTPSRSVQEASNPSLPQKLTTPESSEKAKKRQSFLTRTLWTFIMIGGFIGAVNILRVCLL